MAIINFVYRSLHSSVFECYFQFELNSAMHLLVLEDEVSYFKMFNLYIYLLFNWICATTISFLTLHFSLLTLHTFVGIVFVLWLFSRKH